MYNQVLNELFIIKKGLVVLGVQIWKARNVIFSDFDLVKTPWIWGS
jgi:hypothetical protein